MLVCSPLYGLEFAPNIVPHKNYSFSPEYRLQNCTLYFISAFFPVNDNEIKDYMCQSSSPLANHMLIANVRGLSSTLDGDGGIAAPKKILSTLLQFSPFFLPEQQENCLLIESKDFLYSSRRAKL